MAATRLDIRSLVIGVVAGATIVPVVFWIRDVAPQRDTVQESTAVIGPEIVVPKAPQGPRESQGSQVSAEEPASVSVTAPTLMPEDSATADPDSGRAMPYSETGTGATEQWLARHRQELVREEKDQAWAYFNEQAILGFLSEHPLSTDFDIASIECRTTLCQIQVYGYDESTLPTWMRMMYELGDEPWSEEFYESGSYTGTVDGRFLIVQTMRRQRPEADPR